MKKSTIIIVIFAVIAAIVIVTAALFLFPDNFEAKVAVYNTLSSVFQLNDGTIQPDEINQIEINASIGSDIIPSLNRNTQDISLSIGNYDDGNTVIIPEFKVGNQSKRTALFINNETQNVTLSSDLLENSYTYNQNSLKEQLDSSIFAPDSGSRYALSEELYNEIISFEAEKDDDGTQIKLKDELIKPLCDAIKENVTLAETDGEFKPLYSEKTAKAKVTKITGSNAILEDVAEVLNDLWVNNDRYYTFIKSQFPELTAEEINTEYDNFIADIRSIARKGNAVFEINLYIKGKYLIGADASLSITDPGNAENKEQHLNLTLSFPENPEKTPAFELSAEGNIAGGTQKLSLSYSCLPDEKERITDKMELSWSDENSLTAEGTTYYYSHTIAYSFTGKEQGYEAILDYKAYSSEGEKKTSEPLADYTVKVAGEYKDGNFFSIKLITVTSGEEEKIFDKSYISFRLNCNAVYDYIEPTDPVSIDKLTEDDADTLLSGLETTYNELCVEMNEALDAELFTKFATVAETGSIAADSTDYLSCYDPSTDRLFVLARKNISSDLSVYDGTSMQLIKQKHFDYYIYAMDADNGRFAYSYGNDFVIHFLDENTLEETSSKEFTLDIWYGLTKRDYLKNICIDGDIMFITKEDQHCQLFMVNLNTWDSTAIGYLYRPCLKLDKQHHVLAACDTEVSRSFLYMFDSRTGNEIPTKQQKGFDSSAPYMCGDAALWVGEYISCETGETTTVRNLVPELPYKNGYKIYALLYTADLFTVTLETSTDESIGYTAFYDKKGNEVYDSALITVDTVPGKSNVLYGIAAYDASSIIITRYEFSESYTLNLEK